MARDHTPGLTIGYTHRDQGGIPVSLGDVQRWVDALPQRTRTRLKRGPMVRYGKAGFKCRVCEAADEFYDPAGWKLAAAEYLAEFHSDAYEPLSRECGCEDIIEGASYLRCLLVYLCAGWEGYTC